MPRRIVDCIVKRATKVPFLSVASELAVDEKTIRNVFDNYVTAIENKHDWQAPRFHGFRHDMVRTLFEQHINHPNTHKKK